MNILLVNPPIPDKFKMHEYADEEGRKSISRRVLVGPPLALNELAGTVPEENIVILDQKTERDMNPDYDYIGAVSYEMNSLKPDIVALTCITAQYNSVIKLLEIVKKINKKVLTIVGGLHPSACPQDFIGTGADIIAVGLGKYSFYNIVQELKKNKENADFSHICGLAFNNGNSLSYTRSLCEISYDEFQKNYLFADVLPNRALTDRYNYTIAHMKKKIQYLSTSQGCTHKCNFCSIWKLTYGHYYHREVESIIDELKTMDEYPLIRFCDANTFGDIKKARQLFTRIIEEGLNSHMFMADVRTDAVIKYPDLIELAVRAGLKIVICGLEATSDEELKKYSKENTIDATKRALKVLNEYGISVNGNYIVDPDYEEEDFERIARFVDDNPIFHSGFSILTPFPGTEQWEELKDKIVIKDYDYYNLANSVLPTKLPEKVFYDKVIDLYKLSMRGTEKYMSIYGNKQEGK